ncbi:MAG: hypothetical protein IJ573_08210 [Clostridia bacterium]|nr:hypothetical protein [Clostridia bacterium]
MKRLSVLFLLALLMCAGALAESLPSENNTVFAPTSGQQSSDASAAFDFSQTTVSNAAATPVAIDPIDMPTPTPAPTPNFIYEAYQNDTMGVSFSIPYTWLLNPNTNHDTTVQFVEPKGEMMDDNGYQTRLTVEKVNRGLSQTAADARAYLETTLDTLAGGFTSFTPGNIASASIGKANGAYCYYKAEYTEGEHTYRMNGRIMIVAQGNALYQIRITAPREWYAYYEHAFRKVRSSFKFL